MARRTDLTDPALGERATGAPGEHKPVNAPPLAVERLKPAACAHAHAIDEVYLAYDASCDPAELGQLGRDWNAVKLRHVLQRASGSP